MLDLEPEFERYFAQARTQFPAMFAGPETEKQFRAAMDQMLATMRTFGRHLIVGELAASVRNFMVHDLEAMEVALAEPDLAAEFAESVTTNTGEMLRAMVAGSYSEVLRVIEEYEAGVAYPPLDSVCPLFDCQDEMVKGNA